MTASAPSISLEEDNPHGPKRAIGRFGVPDLGIGVGLRVPHYRHILAQRPKVDFFEIISENFMVPGGKPRYHLEQILEAYPVVQHGVSLNIGGPGPVDWKYLRQLKQLVRRVQPPWVTDHFCWCGPQGAHLHDLLPLPYCWEAIARVVERAKLVQDFLEVRFALENTSSYMGFTSSVMTEWQFLSEICERADIGLLFDVNNVYVSAKNHGWSPFEFISGVPHDRIVQIHLAGHTDRGTHLIDTHRGPVIDAVWQLYRATLRHTGPVATLIEWDDEIPEFDRLLAEAEQARWHRTEAVGGAATGGEASRWPTQPPAPASDPNASHDHRVGSGAACAIWQQGGPRERAAAE